MGGNFFKAIYYLLVIACVGVSSYLSYKGFRSSFAELALPFTFILGIGLFGADALLQRARERGASVWPPLLIFAFFAVFSSASNFNHIYTTFMQGDVVRQTLDSQYARFRNNLIEARESLEDTNAYQFTREQRTNLDRELDRLKSQIFDPLRPGCGERCDIHLSAIERILGKPLSDTARPPLGSPRETVETWFNGVTLSAQRDLETSAQTTSYPAIASVLDQIAQLLAAYDTPKRALAASDGLATLTDLADASEEIERRANAALPTDAKVQLEPIDRTMGRLGEIVFSFENAFKERPNILATILSLILATVIDLFPVVFALVAFGPETGRVGQTANGRRDKFSVLD